VKLSDYDYELPPELIAREPAARRDASRLLVLDRGAGTTAHRRFSDLPELLRSGDLLVVNDTRVLPCRLLGTRFGHTGQVELLLVHPEPPRGERPCYTAIARPARKLLSGTMLQFDGVDVEVVDAPEPSRRIVAFPPGFDVPAFLERAGHVPLPPYLGRPDRPEDRERYQTVYAREPGAVAAPTAGLHFTPELFAALESAGIATARITLHVGPGTFVPVTEGDPRRHTLEAERYTVSEEAAALIRATRAATGRIVAVGTTTVRTLETLAETNEITAGQGRTAKFIYPPYTFRAVDALITNFHLPRSTLLMLVSALAGRDRILATYAEATTLRYRFYSYGDAMLIL